MLEDVSLSLNLLKIFVQHRATLLAQQCCMMLASFEQAFTIPLVILTVMKTFVFKDHENQKNCLQETSFPIRYEILMTIEIKICWQHGIIST